MHDDDDPAHPGCRHTAYFAAGFVAFFALYFGVFGAIMLDEAVFRTMWLSRTMNGLSPELNESISATLQIVYAPLIKISKTLGTLP